MSRQFEEPEQFRYNSHQHPRYMVNVDGYILLYGCTVETCFTLRSKPTLVQTRQCLSHPVHVTDPMSTLR